MAIEEDSDYGKQLSEIHEIVTEGRSRFTGGGAIALVWGVLTAAAIAITLAFPGLGPRTAWVWAGHNVMGWTLTLVLVQQMSQRHGRVSRRGQYILRTWAVWTLAIWISAYMVHSGIEFAGIMSLIVGMGIFVTGLLSESRFSQTVGVAALIVGPGLAMFAPRGLAYVLALGSMVLMIIAFGIGSWVVREK